MTNPIVAKIQALWDEHTTGVRLFPSVQQLRAFFRREGHSDEAIDEAFDIWWDEGYLPDLL